MNISIIFIIIHTGKIHVEKTSARQIHAERANVHSHGCGECLPVLCRRGIDCYSCAHTQLSVPAVTVHMHA